MNPNLTEAYVRRAEIYRFLKSRASGGTDVVAQSKESMADFLAAAERGDATSQNALGVAYFMGAGARKNARLALVGVQHDKIFG